jgi:hypothetical protein
MEDGPDPGPAVDFRLGDHLAQVGDAGRDRRHGDHARAGLGGEKSGQRGLAAPRRPPKDDAGQVSALGQPAQDLDHPALPDHVLKGLGPHPGRQRRVGLRAGRDWKKLPLICHSQILNLAR